MQKILIVEDDKKLRKELETFLTKHGFIAKGLEKFDNTIQDILNENADLVLLDINLPYTDGEFVCKEVRKTSDVPIIMGILQSIAMIIIDLKRPKLNWDSEYAVAKQNLNLIFPVLLSMVNIAILIGLVFLLNDVNVYIGVGIVGILYAVVTVIINKYLYDRQYELADKII